jgi:hypothetical protein
MLPYIFYNLSVSPAVRAIAGADYLVFMLITMILGEVAWLWLMTLYLSGYKQKFIPADLLKKVKLRVVDIPKAGKARAKAKKAKKTKRRRKKKTTKKRRR